MALMIPEKPNRFHPGSLEDVMFESLERLPDEYTVFHSFRITRIKDGTVYESETDFVIFHRKQGVLCLEAKAGAVTYRGGRWFYGNGEPMHNGGPFNQAASNKWKLMELIGNSRLRYLADRIKFLHGVWLPSLSAEQIDSIPMPPEGDRAIVFGAEALDNPLPYIEALFSLNVRSGIITNLTENESERLIMEILCPEFNVFPSANFDTDLKHRAFYRMLNEQAGILNFLSEQRTAVINGAAGTGKTLIAVEKARRHAAAGGHVLFLCYNAELKKHLISCYGHCMIDFMTLDGYVCRLCGTASADYGMAEKKLKDYAAFGSFPYKHVIVDEGQDFGRDAIEETGILRLLHDAVMAVSDHDSSFYVFYDRLQTVQADKIPEFIREADCKLTLHRNCRNTENVCRTSMSLIRQDINTLFLNSIAGKIPRLHFCAASVPQIKIVDGIIDELKEAGIENIVILTLETERDSFMGNYAAFGTYGGCRFTTCRKFKGLEADAVILVDFTEQTVLKNTLLFYVGASRARLRLEVVTDMDNAACSRFMKNAVGQREFRRPMREFASLLNCTAILHH